MVQRVKDLVFTSVAELTAMVWVQSLCPGAGGWGESDSCKMNAKNKG